MKNKSIVSSVFLFVGLFGGVLAAETPARLTDEALRRSLVRVQVSEIKYDYSRPWIKGPGRRYTVAGLVLPGGRILTLANDIRHAGLLEVTKFSSYRRSIAKIVRVDMEINLALLTVDDPKFFEDLTPLAIGADPAPGQELTAVKVNDVFRVYREQLHVKEVKSIADYGFTYIPVTVFRSAEPFRQGGLLLCEGLVCGFIGYASQDKQAESVPPSTFGTFFKRAAEAKYAGFVAQGFKLRSLVDPVLREFYEVPEDLHGCLVVRVLPGTSAFGVLQKDDVLVGLDGLDLDDRCYYNDGSSLDRQKALLLLAKKRDRVRVPGEMVPVRVFRDGKVVLLKMSLIAYGGTAERIPWLVTGQPPYLIENGLVFLELSVPVMRQMYGSNWKTNALKLSYLYKSQRYYDRPVGQRIVFLARVLPDEINRGYEAMQSSPVLKANGKPLHSLKELQAVIDELIAEGAQQVSLLLQGNRVIYLDLEKREAHNKRILGRYRVPAASSGVR